MKRGSNVALTREIPNLRGVVVGVHWDAGAEPALHDNLVLASILCDTAGHALSDEHFVFFNQLSSPDESVSQRELALGDDNEQVEIDLASVPADVGRIAIILYLNEGPSLRRTLGQLKSCRVRLLNMAGQAELVRSEDFAGELHAETAIVLAEVYRHGGDWKFKVIGEGYTSGLAGIVADYHLPLGAGA